METKDSFEKSSKSKWWWEDYDYDYRDRSYSKGSGSRGWLSKIGYGSDYWKPKQNVNEVYRELLSQLQNSANLIGDEERGKVTVSWSSGQDLNAPNKENDNHTIFISPDDLVVGNKISEEVLDAMTGKVYLASTIRETASLESYNKAQISRTASLKNNGRIPCPCGSGIKFKGCCNKTIDPNKSIHKNAVVLWEAIETSIARSKIIEDWSGFGPYIAADSEKSSSKKEDIQKYIDSTVDNPNIHAATLAIAWNLLNSSDNINIPDVYNKCVEHACEIMEEEISSEDRFDSCIEMSRRIYKILKEESSSSADGGEGEGEGEGEGDESGSSGLSVCDGSLLGDKVKNNTDSSLSEQSSDIGEQIGGGNESEAEGLGSSYKYELIKVDPNNHDEISYDDLVSKYKDQIKTIKNSFCFRNNISNLHSYGHRTGDIDENSLFKIRLKDDRVMQKTDTISSKKIAICLLVDESGSMSAGRGDSRIEAARKVAMLLGEGLKSIEGIALSIYGHTAEEECTGVTLREYYSPRQKNMAACMEMDARTQNHDSFAMLHTANLFNKDFYGYDRKILFVISDGLPEGSDYGGVSARRHMNKVSQECLKNGIEVYGIGVDNAFTNENGKSMYGENKFVVLEDVSSSLGVMVRFIRQIAMK
jgi:hypothetical protein